MKTIDHVKALAINMRLYAIEDVLSADYYLKSFDSDAIEQLLEYLTPELMKVTVISKKYEGVTDSIEKWYDTEYLFASLSEEELENLNDCGLNEAFKLPEENQFKPFDLKLVTNLSKYPRLIYSTKLAHLWFKEDLKFQLPKAFLNFKLMYLNRNIFLHLKYLIKLLFFKKSYH